MDSSFGKPMTRVGIFGATFDPPHIAHFIAAEWVADELQLDKVILIPANMNPLKQAHTPAPPQVRLKMVSESIKDSPMFEVSSVELDRGGVSYMVDTVHSLRKTLNVDSYSLYLLIGADAASEFHQWKDYKELAEIATVVIFNRPGYNLSEISAALNAEHLVVRIPSLDISSTSIRDRVKAKKPIDFLVLPGCARIIKDLHLYI